jgi:hypothetical protein
MNNSSGNRSDDKPMAKVFFVFSQIVMFFFGIPFAAFGIFAFCDAWKNVHSATPNPKHNPIATIIFGLIFSAFGFGIMIWAATAGRRKKKAEESFFKQTDGGTKPWLLRSDWAAGKIKSSANANVKFLLIWSFAALALSVPGVWQISQKLHEHDYKVLIVLIFPLVAFGLLGYTFKLWRSHRRFGDCFFELAQIPAPLGGSLDGMIQTGARIRLEQGLHLKLSCIRRVVTGSGKNQSTQETILWQDEKILSPNANLPEPEPGHSGIPVFFKLPADQPESYARGRESVSWRLEAKAKMSGPNFFAVFDVPVFQVVGEPVAETGETAVNESDPTAALQASVEEIRRNENSRIKITDGPNGREFYFPAAQNVGSALFVTIAAFVCIGIAIGTYHLHAPVAFPIVFGLFSVLTICGALSAWFKSSRVTIDSTTVRVTTRWLVFSRAREFSASDVARFETKIGLQSGSQIFTDILIVRRSDEENFTARDEKLQDIFQDGESSGPKKVIARFQQVAARAGVTVASSLASKPEADWLVREMTKALGRQV